MHVRYRWPSVAVVGILLLTLGGFRHGWGQEPIFSGPQATEPLPSFLVRGVLGDDAGKEMDFVAQAAGKPIVLVFVHEMNRPTIGFTRALTSYTVQRAADGVTTGVVWLDEDATEAENTVRRIQHALTPEAPIGISPDGREGPGSYGLNRNVALTILVGNEGKVTANFALVQPSVQADLPKVLEAVVAVAGGKVPALEELPGVRGMMRAAAGDNAPDESLRQLLRPVIQKAATPEQVDAAAKVVEAHVADNAQARKEVGLIAQRIIDAGRLSSYGTPRAQEYLQKWAKEYGQKAEEPAKSEER